ncbi:MAG: hypothetical protein ISR72_02885 [Methylobacter sp.]|nr:hypothetical protein [Methylobacter sp.]
MINTGNTVLQGDGVLSSCTKRQGHCGYACCKFSEGNWIMLLPGEYELAAKQNLKLDHLSFENNSHAVCHVPCQKGDLKPIDCSWYPLFPANLEATKFLVADHRKCPIPNHELIDKMWSVYTSVLAWEQKHQGSLEQIVGLSRDFVGYMPFPYKIENGLVVDMTMQDLEDIGLPIELPKDYVCKEWTVISLGYSATITPDDEK